VGKKPSADFNFKEQKEKGASGIERLRRNQLNVNKL
jgi:hypothetical protein